MNLNPNSNAQPRAGSRPNPGAKPQPQPTASAGTGDIFADLKVPGTPRSQDTGAPPGQVSEKKDIRKEGSGGYLKDIAGMIVGGLKGFAWDHWSFVKDFNHLKADRKLQDPDDKRINTLTNIRALVEGTLVTAASACLTLPVGVAITAKVLSIFAITNPVGVGIAGVAVGLAFASWIGNNMSEAAHESQRDRSMKTSKKNPEFMAAWDDYQQELKEWKLTPKKERGSPPESPKTPIMRGSWYKDTYEKDAEPGRDKHGSNTGPQKASSTAVGLANNSTNANRNLKEVGTGREIAADAMGSDMIS